MIDDSKVEEGIRRLTDKLRDLLAVWNEVYAKEYPHDGKPMALMVLTFGARQGEHAKSVLVLERRLDASLIARSMVEGSAQLVWAHQKPTERATLWQKFGAIRDWRVSREQAARGSPFPPERQAELEEAVQRYGHLFLKSKYAEIGGKGIDDPYRDTWYGVTIRQIFEAVEAKSLPLYRHVYKPFSNRHHWDVAEFEWRSDHDSGDVRLIGRNNVLTVTSLAVAFWCLWSTLKLLDEIIGVGIATRLTELNDEYWRTFDFDSLGR